MASAVGDKVDASPEHTGTGTGTMSTFLRATYFLGPPSLVLCTLFVSPRLALTMPPIIAPTALAYYYCHRMQPPSQRVPEENLMRTYVTAFLTGIPLTEITRLVLLGSFLNFLHGKDAVAGVADSGVKNAPVSARAGLAQAVLINCLCRGLLGEILHGRGVMHAVNRELDDSAAQRRQISKKTAQRKRRLSRHTYLQLGIAVGFGFATMESLVAAYAYIQSGLSLNTIVVELGWRIVTHTLEHTLTTLLSALRMARGSTIEGDTQARETDTARSPGQDESNEHAVDHARPTQMSFSRAIMPSVLCHGILSLVLPATMILVRNTNWPHSKDIKRVLGRLELGIAFATLAWSARWEWKKLTEAEEKEAERSLAEED